MKIRIGHVSNSSTTSFCVYGIDIWQERKKHDEEVAENMGLDVYHGQGDDIYIGLEESDMKRDETRIEFEKRAAQMIASYLKEMGIEQNYHLDYHKESFYDG